MVLQGMLESFSTWFPNYTDHSTLHSMDVLYYCNQLLGEQVQALTIPECYATVMACYLHDVGMAIPRNDLDAFTQKLDMEEYRKKNPYAKPDTVIRDYHHELSGLFIRKYADLFDIPSEDLLFAIIQISRGHRKTDLFDETEYPNLQTPDGVIRTAFLSALVRLADEIDMGADRNPELLFDSSKLTRQWDIDIFGSHESIRLVEVTENTIVLHTKLKEPRYEALIKKLAGKIQKTLDYCRDAAKQCSDLRITQERVEIVELNE